MEVIRKYFPDLNEKQITQFIHLDNLYMDWNTKINLISRKDIHGLYIRHILHSLAIAKFIRFESETKILDVGTGGGFPGIPLAIFFPQAEFTLIDSIGKKVMVTKDIIEKTGLENCKSLQMRAENISEKYDFVCSRAVTAFPKFYSWIHNNISNHNFNSVKNGIIYLKGGDLSKELNQFKHRVKTMNISDYFHEDYFKTKKIIYMPIT